MGYCLSYKQGTHCTSFAFQIRDISPELKHSGLQAAERFLRERMHGEGNTMRQLASMGYRLSYEQDPRTEFDFTVTNMSIDLRSGVRLLRAAELLKGAATCLLDTYLVHLCVM